MGSRGRREPRGLGSTKRPASDNLPLRRVGRLAWNLQLGRAGISMKLDGSRMPNRLRVRDGRYPGFRSWSARTRRPSNSLGLPEERRDQIQDDIPEAVAQ